MLHNLKKLYQNLYRACLNAAPYIIPVLVLLADFPPYGTGK